VSLFAFISDLCPNRQVAGGGRGSSAGIDGLEESGDADMTVAAEVSLAVAAKAAAENFPVALRILPRRYRAHLTALYGFARLVDDIGDEPLPGLPADASPETVTATRLRLLDDLQLDVAKIYDGGEPQLDAIKALKVTVRQCAVPQKPLDDLIQANRQDQLVTRYETYDELKKYCELSANPVGQVVLAIMSTATPARITASDSICTALQIVEHTQDVAEDLANGRIYLPREDLERFGVTELELAKPQADANVRQLIKFEADRAEQLLDEGAPLIGTLHGAARIAVAGYLAGGRAALKAIADKNYDVLQGAPKPGKADTLVAMARCYLKGR
jgi:squalene synthase HpnC